MITLKLSAHYSSTDELTLYRKEQSQALAFLLKRLQNGEEVSKPKNSVQAHVMGCWPTICCKAYETMVVSAKMLIGQADTRKKKDLEKLRSLEHDLKNLDSKLKNYLSLKWKLTKKIQIKKARILRPYGVCLGSGRSLSEYNRYLNLGDMQLASQHFEKYKSTRCQPYQMVGERGERGNRKFDLSQISTGVLIWKPKAKVQISISLQIKSKVHRQLLAKLQEAITCNRIPVSIKLTDGFVMLSFDEDILNGTAFNEKAYKERAKALKESGETDRQKFKDLKASFYREQETRLSEVHETRKDRVFAVDLNPENLGFSILEASKDKTTFKVLKVFGFQYNHKKLTSDQRKYYLSLMYKQAFIIAKHYQCGVFAMEDLDFKPTSKEANSTSFNRLTKNLWNRKFQEDLIAKHCTRNGLVLKTVLPQYSSFVGNLMFKFWDPIAASCEIGRRGLIQSKELDAPWYPSAELLLKSDRVMGLSEAVRNHGESVPDSMYKLYRLVREAGLKYRRPVSSSNRLTLSTLKRTLVHF